jgi:hemoglobin-like flavoprotein
MEVIVMMQPTKLTPEDDAAASRMTRTMWATIARLSEQERARLAREFYRELLASYPQLSTFFGQLDVDQQERKLAAALDLLALRAADRQLFAYHVVRIGIAHAHRGIGRTEYAIFARTLAGILARCQAELPAAQAEQWWMAELSTIVETMLAVSQT